MFALVLIVVSNPLLFTDTKFFVMITCLLKFAPDAFIGFSHSIFPAVLFSITAFETFSMSAALLKSVVFPSNIV